MSDKKSKILLLNPPGKKLYLRDYYCSKVSKANYVNAPIDLVMLSGIFNNGNYEVDLIDATIDRLSIEACLKSIKEKKYDLVMSLIGSASFDEDKKFLKNLSLQINSEIFVIGDVVINDGRNFLTENPYIKGVITNFTSDGIQHYLNQEKDKITDLLVAEEKNIVEYPKKDSPQFNINPPIHELFLNKRYGVPFMRNHPCVSTLLSYGCPFQCSFCIMNTFKYSDRSIENIIKEFDYLKSLNVREILFLDQTIGINKKQFKELLEKMISKKYNFSWSCFSRVDVVDEEQIKLMKDAGCHTIMFGVESASDSILKKYKKDYTKKQVISTFAIAKKVGIKTLATFIVGLPEETKEMIEETIRFSRGLDPDYASFSFAVPRLGTDLRTEMIDEGLVESNEMIMDQSGQTLSAGTKTLSKAEMAKLKRKAVWGFYLRPKYVIKRLRSLTSLVELKNNFRGMFGILKNGFNL